jgi:hypothetical protein
MDDSKVKDIREWPTPKTVRGVRSFLGLAKFYRRFIEGYAQVARPLNDLTKKNIPFAWKEAQQTAFDTQKNHFTIAPILAYPDNDRVFHLETNASNFAAGAVLFIEQNGKWHPVVFSSHSMSPEECNYPVADKKMLSVIRSFEQWHHYLEGAHHEFEIWNDHANLQWFMKHQDLNCRQARWAQYLSRFNFKWLHKAGTTMGNVAALSRREDHLIGIEKDNMGILVIPPDQIRSVTEVDIKRKDTRTCTTKLHLPRVSTFVKKYTNICERCAQMKPSDLAPPGKLHPLESPDIPWTEVTANFTTDLSLSNGFDSILVVVDRFSKKVEFIPCNKTTTTLDTAQLYLYNVWKNHGLPSSIVSD